jgi:hypothetical protein
MRKVIVEELMFIDAFERDEVFSDPYSQSAYLDLETGKVIWVFEEDYDAEMYAGIDPEENAALRNQIDAHPERYLYIPGRGHGEHHDILRDFLDSHWTDDEELWTRARNAYSGSIGGWRKEVDNDNVVHAYYDFRDRRIKELAQEFFLENDIQPIWR